jgi:hypothetical protein
MENASLIMKRHVSLLACLALVPATLAAQTPPAGASSGNPAHVPRPAPVEGRPVETRPPEKKDNAPAFPEQTRAPYHATAVIRK